MTSLRQWLTEQLAEAIRPISERIAHDITSRLRVDVTIRIHLED